MEGNFKTEIKRFLEGFLNLKYIENTRIGKRCIYCNNILENNFNDHTKNCLRSTALRLLEDLNKKS